MRASSTALIDRPMADEVFLEGLHFYAYHGVNPEERSQGQRFVVDVRIAADLRDAGRSDDLTRTISYSAVYRLVRGIVEGEPRSLIEAVAEEVAATILREFAAARSVAVTVRKPGVAIKGAILDAAGVRIVRSRDG
jgi:7,8-dihydroneopterin aldolase/epimerase/oxygenase